MYEPVYEQTVTGGVDPNADMSELFLLSVSGDDLVYPVCLAPPLHHRWEAPPAVSGKSTFYVD